jgi:CRP-like cAMP-binding protein
MPKRDAANDQLLSVLQVAKNRLEYLTPNDWTLLLDRAKLVHFAPEQALVQVGKQTKTVYLLVRGEARVESAAKNTIAQLGPGEVCGEMAFLESSLPSASVIALENLDAYALEWTALGDLFELFPHLGSRFYRSLAVYLSRRLREQIASKKTAAERA